MLITLEVSKYPGFDNKPRNFMKYKQIQRMNKGLELANLGVKRNILGTLEVKAIMTYIGFVLLLP